MADDDAFTEFVKKIQYGSPLVAAYHQAEQHYQHTFPDGGYFMHEVARHAFMSLDEATREAEMDVLFNAFVHSTDNGRKFLELCDKEPDGNTYLHHGDLDVITDTLSGAMALGTMNGDDTEPGYLDKIFPDGMIPVPIELLERFVNELELLQHRLNVRSTPISDKT